VLRVIREEPGITVRGLSERLKVNRPDLYRLTHALTKAGRLRTEGPKLYLAETQSPTSDQNQAR
jgi:DNA-binding IclR family transcriptional regulator